mmetsp:Transcript_3867/g.12005  ORF Transcript_3867/g.12005 Transcript_3867/m.12005 type:complete len:156 (+) Transcript_3867:568-1035(+)
MFYFVPVDAHMYNFEPRQQFRVEELLVEHWDGILAMVVAPKKQADVDFDDDEVRDAARGPFADLLQLVDSTRRCGTAAEFVDALEWLLRTKELMLLRAHVCGDEPGETESGQTRWSRDGPVVFQLASALPNAARGRWYSKATTTRYDDCHQQKLQ